MRLWLRGGSSLRGDLKPNNSYLIIKQNKLSKSNNMILGTFYSDKVDFDAITTILKKHLPKAKLSYSSENEYQIINIEVKKGLFSSPDKLKISYRQRLEPNSESPNTDCSLSNNLRGLHGFVGNIPAQDQQSKEKFQLKINRVNCEFSLIQEKGSLSNTNEIIKDIASEFDAILFVQPDSIFSKSQFSQHFLNKNLNLILDQMGQSEVTDFGPEIDQLYNKKQDEYQNYLKQIPQEVRERKLANEVIIAAQGIKVNKYLPAIPNEAVTTLRTANEIAERVTVLAIINLFASNHISAEQTLKILEDNGLTQKITTKEKDLLHNPTDEKKSIETWKCEAIWVLLWALNLHDNLGDTASLCDLGNIPKEDYPIHNPKGFANRTFDLRSKKEILDHADLYYRYNWAGVDLRIHRMESSQLNPGIVHERLYAFNWLTNYMGQDWDNVSCDS